jgi:hypothetical protein
MKMISREEYERHIRWGWDSKMRTQPYLHLPFLCACGTEHRFGEAALIRDLPRMCVVLVCPNNPAVRTGVKIKGMFRTKLIPQFGVLDAIDQPVTSPGEDDDQSKWLVAALSELGDHGVVNNLSKEEAELLHAAMAGVFGYPAAITSVLHATTERKYKVRLLKSGRTTADNGSRAPLHPTAACPVCGSRMGIMSHEGRQVIGCTNHPPCEWAGHLHDNQCQACGARSLVVQPERMLLCLTCQAREPHHDPTGDFTPPASNWKRC